MSLCNRRVNIIKLTKAKEPFNKEAQLQEENSEPWRGRKRPMSVQVN